MRDRLVEVLNETFDAQYTKSMLVTAAHTADHLIADGWIRLPCKVGDTVYFPNEGYHDSAEIEEIHINENGVSFAWVQYDYGPDIVEVWDACCKTLQLC